MTTDNKEPIKVCFYHSLMDIVKELKRDGETIEIVDTWRCFYCIEKRVINKNNINNYIKNINNQKYI